MNRNDFRELSLIRLNEARVLLKNGNFEGGYYLSGYIIECGLKACIAKQTKLHDFPDKSTVNESHTHDLTKLVRVAGLALDLEKETKDRPQFAVNWSIVKDWSEGSRYERHTRKESEALYSAVSNRQLGVLRWIKRHW